MSIVLVMFASIVWLLTGLSGTASVPPPLTVHNLPCNSLIAIHELVNAIGKDYAYVARVLRLTLLAPEIVHAVLTGALPERIGEENLRLSMPVLWSEQKKLLGIG